MEETAENNVIMNLTVYLDFILLYYPVEFAESAVDMLLLTNMLKSRMVAIPLSVAAYRLAH